MEECNWCKSSVKLKETMTEVFISVPGPHPGCDEFAPAEFHPVLVCSSCSGDCGECSEELGTNSECNECAEFAEPPF